MDSSTTIFGIAAPIISIIGFIPYFVSIFKRKTKPSGASWWTWTLLTLVAVSSSWSGGADWRVLLLPLWLCLSQLAVAIFSLKYGENKWDFKNKLFVGVAILSLILWGITGNPLLALGFVVGADLFASFPNFRHVAKNPEQEDRLAWGLGWIAALCALFAIQTWNFVSSAWAIYFFFNMSVVMYFLFRKGKGVEKSF